MDGYRVALLYSAVTVYLPWILWRRYSTPEESSGPRSRSFTDKLWRSSSWADSCVDLQLPSVNVVSVGNGRQSAKRLFRSINCRAAGRHHEKSQIASLYSSVSAERSLGNNRWTIAGPPLPPRPPPPPPPHLYPHHLHIRFHERIPSAPSSNSGNPCPQSRGLKEAFYLSLARRAIVTPAA